MFSDLDSKEYAPILSISRAEMVAFEELPEKTKDRILPIFPLKGWGVTTDLQKTLDRVELSIGHRPWIADLDIVSLDLSLGQSKDKIRPVHNQLDDLRNSNNGYESWCSFVQGVDAIIPCVRLEEESQLENQLDLLKALERPIALRFVEGKTLPGLSNILGRVAAKEIPNLYVILDYEQKRQNDLSQEAIYSSHINAVLSLLPDAKIIFSATSFPNSFSHIATGNDEQEIYERKLFNRLDSSCQEDLIFSDRGSVNLRRGGGGGETIPPRIDYPLKEKWVFYRQEIEDGDDKNVLYKKVANSLIGNTQVWNSDLYIWGTEMIRRTAAGNITGKRVSINSPASATATRINVHLYLQAHYDVSGQELMDTDDDWDDDL